MSAKVGERVGAFKSADETTVNLFGYGVRIEDEVPPEDCGGMGDILHEIGATNPTLLLDSGKKVYGCECWWGPEAKVVARIGERTVVQVDIEEARAKAGGHPS